MRRRIKSWGAQPVYGAAHLLYVYLLSPYHRPRSMGRRGVHLLGDVSPGPLVSLLCHTWLILSYPKLSHPSPAAHRRLRAPNTQFQTAHPRATSSGSSRLMLRCPWSVPLCVHAAQLTDAPYKHIPTHELAPMPTPPPAVSARSQAVFCRRAFAPSCCVADSIYAARSANTRADLMSAAQRQARNLAVVLRAVLRALRTGASSAHRFHLCTWLFAFPPAVILHARSQVILPDRIITWRTPP